MESRLVNFCVRGAENSVSVTRMSVITVLVMKVKGWNVRLWLLT